MSAVQDPARLGACERFFYLIMDLPDLKARLSAVLFTRAFPSSVANVRHHLHLMNTAASELRDSSDFRLLLQHILAVGNCLNEGTSKGGAQVRTRCLLGLPCYTRLSYPLVLSCLVFFWFFSLGG